MAMPPLQPTTSNSARERGIAVMLTAFLLVFTIPAVGLAIDAGVLYLVRSKLSSACDAAALATARNLNLGLTLEDQRANAIARGTAFFNANFPTGYLGTSNVSPIINIAQTTLNTLTVTASATGNANLYFMRLLGNTAQLTSSEGRASRRDVNIILVLDRSGSMGGAPCTAMINSSKTFANMFINGRDRMGMISYGASVFRAYPPTTDFKNPGSSILSAIDLVTCTGWTNTPTAYWNAYQELVAINQPLALNMIVLFTDGVPTSVTARYPIRTVADVRYGSWHNNLCGGGPSGECTFPKSPCRDDNNRVPSDPLWGTFAPKMGVVSGGGLNLTTGDTPGLVDPVATGPSSGEPLIAAAQRTDCAMSVRAERLREDAAYIPAQDVNGLNTTGYMDSGLLRFPATHPYAGQIRVDSPNNIARVSMNLSDNAAAAARNHPNLGIVTYAIGLGSGVDHNLLRRMSNDLVSPIYDNSKVNGIYVHAPTTAQIGAAYARIASEILRLAQ